jgi:hypothetical protein
LPFFTGDQLLFFSAYGSVTHQIATFLRESANVYMDFRFWNLILILKGTSNRPDRKRDKLRTAEDGNTVERVMKKVLAMVVVGLTMASCTATERGAGIGAGTGAVIGGLATGNVRGAAVGAAIGGVSGAVIGSVSEQPGQCYYRDRYGRRYIDNCPRNY